jgi:hypothetical protein
MAIERILDLSTAHVTPETLIHNKVHLYLVADYELGAIYYVPPFADIDDDLPEDLKLVMKYASINDCLLIRFDADAPFIEALPRYEWMETISL